MIGIKSSGAAPFAARRHPLEAMSFIGILFRRLSAWRIRHAAAAELTILEARRRLAEARRLTEEAEAEVELQQALQGVPGEQGVQLLAPQAEIERLLLERERLRRQRLQHGLSSIPLQSMPGDVEWEISDQQIETLAVKAVAQFAGMPPGEAERAWGGWRRELEQRLPPYAVAEVVRKAEQLRQMAG